MSSPSGPSTEYVALASQLSPAPDVLGGETFWTGEVAGRHWALGPVRDLMYTLHADEATLLAGAVVKRRFEFATGRYLAHHALASLGFPVDALLAADRRPLWPVGVVGSITHTSEFAAAVVAADSLLAGIGVDAEQAGALDRSLFPKVLTPRERAAHAAAASLDDLGTLVFSAKEAVYKAINPLVGRYIDFLEVEIDVDVVGAQYRATYVGDTLEPSLLAAGRGGFARRWGHWVTHFELPVGVVDPALHTGDTSRGF